MMSDDITARVKDWTNTAEYAVAHRVGVPFGVSEVKMLLDVLAEVERLRAGREVERGMLTAAAAEIQDLGFKVEQLQAEQDEDRDEIHTLRRHLADEEAETERLRGALGECVTLWRERYDEGDPHEYGDYNTGLWDCIRDIEGVLLRGDR